MHARFSLSARRKLGLVAIVLSLLLSFPMSASASTIGAFITSDDTIVITRHMNFGPANTANGGSYYVDTATYFGASTDTVYIGTLRLTFNIVGSATGGRLELRNNSGLKWASDDILRLSMSGQVFFEFNVSTLLTYYSYDAALMIVKSWPGASWSPAFFNTDIQALAPEYQWRPYFSDANRFEPYYYPLMNLAQRDIVRGYGDGRFGPSDTVNRAQMAGMIARGMGWDAEDHYWSWCDYYGQRCGYAWRNFNDRCDAYGCVDDNLWRNILTLSWYGVAKGYGDGRFGSFDPVLRVQTMAFITRAMVVKGYWQWQPNISYVYPNIPWNNPHRQDVSTHFFYAGGGPDSNPLANWDAWLYHTPREWFVRDLWTIITIREN